MEGRFSGEVDDVDEGRGDGSKFAADFNRRNSAENFGVYPSKFSFTAWAKRCPNMERGYEVGFRCGIVYLGAGSNGQ